MSLQKYIYLIGIHKIKASIKNIISSSNMSNITNFPNSSSNNSHLKHSSDRKFYHLPDEYANFKNDQHLSEQSGILLNNIYSNISSRKAKFEGPFGWRSVLYCDYAASGQPLNFIEDYINKNVLPFYGNTHTIITDTSLQSTYFQHEAKDIVRKAVNASEQDAVIYTGNGCTSAVNKLIHCLQLNHSKSPIVVFVGPFEHHSNLLPWRELNAQKYHNPVNILIGSFSAASNITGTLTDDIAISILLHKYGALSFWDYAAAAPYVNIDMNPIVIGNNEGLAYKDAIFFSMHKFVGGPGSPGVLVAKKNIFVSQVPYEPGGGTVFFVSQNNHRYLKDIEMRQVGGTPSIIGDIKAAMALQLKEAVGTKVISEKENNICRLAFEKWKGLPELKLLGSTSIARLPTFSFVILHLKSGLYLHHNFVCALLNDINGIQTRSGCACAGPYALDLLGINESLALKFDEVLAEERTLDRNHLRRKGEYSNKECLRPGFIRLTLPYFMSDLDIEFVLECVSLIAKHGWKMLPQYSLNPETGEWKHKKKQVFLDRKWLGSISYKSGHFTVKEGPVENRKILSYKETIEEFQSIIDNASQVAAKKFIPDQQLIFSSESSELRWFLLPSEAKQYVFNELSGQIKTPVFITKNYATDRQLNLTEELKNIDEINANIPFHNTSVSNEGNILVSKVNETNLNSNCPLAGTKIDIAQLVNTEKCRWHSPPSLVFRPFLKALNKFEMIKDGDNILVCISGGKDSLSLLHTLHQYQFYAKKQDIHFKIGAMTVDPKSPLYDPRPLKGYLKALNVPYFYEEQDIVGQAASMEKCTSICSFCSRLKRGRIYACAHREKYNVIALGQHLDDLAESFIMSVFHNGRLRTMKANYTDKSSSLRIIRPFVFVREKDLRSFATTRKLPIIAENCPACFEIPKERHRVKQLLATQEIQFPNLYRSLKTAMYPLMAINATGIEDKILGKESSQYLDMLSIDDDDF